MEQTWIRGPIIGRGATATVSLASSISEPNRVFAIKSSHISRSAYLRNEHRILSAIGPHPNLITCLGFDVSGEVCDLRTEYVPGGTLADRIRRNDEGRLTEPLIKFYAGQILTGLEFLHANGVVHCDIKSENMLLGDDGSVKIADLGFSKAQGLMPVALEFSGTPAFMAPEVARGEAQGFAADVWALGCIIVEMATGKSPWPEETNPVSALYRIGFSGDIPTIPSSLSDEGRDFVVKCFRKDPTERLTARELLNHPFISDFKVIEPLMKTRSSPTCVLDLAFWDHLDADADDDDDGGGGGGGDSSNSACERIGSLHSGPPSTSRWHLDENWKTVRTSGIHEQSQITPSDQIRTHFSPLHRALVGSSNKYPVSSDDDCVLLNLTCNPKPLFNPESTSHNLVG